MGNEIFTGTESPPAEASDLNSSTLKLDTVVLSYISWAVFSYTANAQAYW